MTERPLRDQSPYLEGDAALAAVYGLVNERQLQERLRRLCLACGLQEYHPYRSQKSQQGYPDSTIVRPAEWGPPYVVWVELKTQRGRLRPHQRVWGRLLAAVERATGGLVAYRLVRPTDFAALEALLLSGCRGGAGARTAPPPVEREEHKPCA